MTFRRTPLAVLVCVALAWPAWAAEPVPASAPREATKLPKVEVAALVPAVRLDTPGTVSVLTREQMNRHLVTTIRDLVRYEPGVSAIGTAGRFGLDSFSIRGLSGNRTYMEIDGVPMADSFGADIAGGSFRAGRDFIDLDDIKRVEIIRGPISALYPSSALGGAVILTTKDPADYLRPGKHSYASVKEQYDGADRSFDTTATLAGGDRRNSFMLVVDHRVGHATRDRGDVGGTGATRTKPDPMRYHLNSLLGKYVHVAASGRTDRVIVDASRTRTDTDGLSELVPDPYEGFVPDYYLSQDTDTRASVSAGQWFPHLDGALADTLDWQVYWQQSRTHTDTQTDTPTVARYFMTMPLQERVFGGKLVAVKHLGAGSAVAQTISYGMSASRTNAQSYADGYGVDKQTGAVGTSSAFLPGNYPLQLIPESNTDRFAVFGQDEIALLDDRLVVTPGVRVERYAYQPQADALYLAYNPGYVPSDYDKNNVSPKLGLIWHFNGNLSAYADYAYGFRAPLYSDLAGSWNEQQEGINIAFLPSPDLKSETSRNAEIGLRGQGDAGWFDLAAYYNRYRNFIWSGYQLSASQVPSWADQTIPGTFYNLFFQAVNAPRAFIKGVEASGQLRLGAFDPALQGWSLRAAASIASGRLIEPGDDFYSPLNTVDPAKLVVGINYDATNWGVALVGTGVRRHTVLSDPTYFRPGGYGTIDFYAHWKPVRNVALYFGASNLTNRKYWDWGNLNGGTLGNLVTGNGVNDAGTNGIPADRLTMPGRTFSVAARLSF